MQHTNVTDFLLQSGEPEKTALLFLRENLTYARLREEVNQTAAFALQLGAQKGDRVLLLADNSPFWVTTYLGVMRAGLVCVPLSPTLRESDLQYVLDTTEARLVFAQRSFLRRAGDVLGNVRIVTETDFMNSDSGRALPATTLDDLAALMFTSGSTGEPLAVMVTHGNIIANTESIIASLHLTARDRMMAVLPFYYCFGTSLLHTHLRIGGSLVIDSRFMYPETVLQRLIETECTGFAGVPSHFQLLLRNSSLSRKAFPSLRYVQQAGGHLAPSFIRQLREAIEPASVFIMYGQTEATARLSVLPPEFLETKLGSIGKGIPGVRLRVLNVAGHDVQPGESGEIVAGGPSIAKGYWRAPQESESTFREGTLYTGDIATVDEDGFIFIVDRARDFLKCGGQRVSSRQLEEQLLGFEEVLEAAVIGVPDDILGESVKAFVVPRSSDNGGLTERLRLFCKMHLPPEFVPGEIVVLTALPRNSSGKVLKSRLREL